MSYKLTCNKIPFKKQYVFFFLCFFYSGFVKLQHLNLGFTSPVFRNVSKQYNSITKVVSLNLST